MWRRVWIGIFLVSGLLGGWHYLAAQSYTWGPLALSDCTTTGQALQWNQTTRLFQCSTMAVVPAGSGVLIPSGNCPSGFTVNNSFILTTILVGSKVCIKD